MTVYYAAGLPALISTGITIIYFFLKVGHYLAHAISHQTKGRVATPTPGCGQHQHRTDPGEEGDTEVCQQISGHFSEQYGGGTQRSPGSISLPRRRQNIRLPSRGNVTEYSEEPVVSENAKDCQAEGIKIPKTIMAKDPVTHVLTPQEYLQKVETGTMPPMDNHQMMKEMAENATVNNQMKFMMMDFRDIERPTPPKTPQAPKCK